VNKSVRNRKTTRSRRTAAAKNGAPSGIPAAPIHRCDCEIQFYLIEEKSTLVEVDPHADADDGDLVVVGLSDGGFRIESYIGQKHGGLYDED